MGINIYFYLLIAQRGTKRRIGKKKTFSLRRKGKQATLLCFERPIDILGPTTTSPSTQEEGKEAAQASLILILGLRRTINPTSQFVGPDCNLSEFIDPIFFLLS